MAVVITKSAGITNRDSTPVNKNNPTTTRGALHEMVGTLETVNGDSVGSQYRFCQVPSNARISQILAYADDIGATTAMDLGVYRTTEDGGAVVDADFFASALVLNAGAIAVEVTHESTVFDIDDIEKPLWLALGLTQDPGCWYDVVGTLTGAADAAGTIAIKVRYVQ